MAAPQFVPTDPTHHPRSYVSPPRRFDHWPTDRPGSLGGSGQPQPDSGQMGVPGPDQGYLLKLVPMLRGELHLTEGELLADVERGCTEIGLKRAAIADRAPILADLRVAYTVWGFLDPQAPEELVGLRRPRFEGMRLTAHHYAELRTLVDAVPETVLRLTPAEILDAYRTDWRSLTTMTDGGR